MKGNLILSELRYYEWIKRHWEKFTLQYSILTLFVLALYGKARTCQNCVTIFKSFAFMNNCFISNSFSVFPERFKLVTKSHARNTR